MGFCPNTLSVHTDSRLQLWLMLLYVLWLKLGMMRDGFKSQSGEYVPDPLFMDVLFEGKQLSRNPYYCTVYSVKTLEPLT